MQQALPYRTTWFPSIPTENRSTTPSGSRSSTVGSSKKERMFLNNGGEGGGDELRDNVKNMVTGNAVIVFGRRGCCMCHVVKRLLLSLGVNPVVYEVENEEDEIALMNELMMTDGNNDGRKLPPLRPDQLPSVFIGGKLFGGLDRLMGAHISGELIPILKEAGALWL